MSNTRKAIQGIKWNYAATAAQLVAQLVFIAVMARLLEPAAFGLVAMATLVIRFGIYLSGAGIRSYLIQKPDLSTADKHASTFLTISVGCGFFAMIYLLAPEIAAYFETPNLEPVARVLSSIFLIAGIALPVGAIMHREMRFGAFAAIETAAYVVGYLCVGLPMAYFGFGVWALVAANLSQQLITMTSFLIATPGTIGMQFGTRELRGALVTGSHFAANSVLDYLVLSAPTWFVGKQLGAADLGIYNRTSTLVNLPTNAVSAGIAKVVFPYLSALQEDVGKFRQAYARSAMLSSLGFVPLCLGMLPAASEIILVVLGDQWIGGRGTFQILATAFAIQFVSMQLGQCADSLRKLRERTRATVVTIAATVAAMYAFSDYGLEGAALGVLVGQIVQFLIYANWILRWLDMRLPQLWLIYAPALVVGACVALATGLPHFVLTNWPPIATLAVQLVAAALVFAGCVLLYPSRELKRNVSAAFSHIGFAQRIPLLVATLRVTGHNVRGEPR